LLFQRTSRVEDAHQREFAAARTVQQVLIPNDTPILPGFTVDTVYLPAGIVGGDFFQVLSAGGGAVAVVGDVSGKGIAAATATTSAEGLRLPEW
jgi:sigma-B regulation protein RsbU (phosphoserine phosphatase)